MAQSQARLIKVMANNVSGSAPAPATDGFLIYNDGSPIATETETINLTELTGAYTKRKSLIGRQLYQWNGTTMLQASGTAGTAPSIDKMFKGCALGATIAADTSVKYEPVSTSFATTNIYTDLDGLEYQLTDGFGTFVMSGSAGQGVECAFSYSGVYNVPVATTSFGSFTAGDNNAETMKLVALEIGSWVTGSADKLVFKSFSFDRGLTIGERTDANSSTGLIGLAVEDSNPTLQVVVEAKTQLNAQGVEDLWADLTGSNTKQVTWTHGSGAGKLITFDFPQAQLTNIGVADGDGGIRTWTLDYKIGHTGDDVEFSMLFA
jgi:hypothetical protein